MVVTGVAEIVRIDEPDPGLAITAGLNAAVVPAGTPVAANETTELNPPETVEVMVELALAPCCTLIDAGDTETAKFGFDAPGIVRFNEKSSTTNEVFAELFSMPIR